MFKVENVQEAQTIDFEGYDRANTYVFALS